MTQSARTPTLLGQVITCGLMLVLAIVVTVTLHGRPIFASWAHGADWVLQLGAGAAFALVAAVASTLLLAVPRFREKVPVPDAVQRMDLTGSRPVVIGLLAGVGEETLFRAALQPLLGLWFGSAVFAIAHIRTAAVGTKVRWKQAAYMVNVFFVGIALGLLYEYVGLLAAILVHAVVDIVGLVVAREVARSAVLANAG